jgi:hypothetical protein
MALTPDTVVLPQTPLSRTAVLNAAETAFHNPTTMVDLLTIADNANGARITKLFAIPRAAIGTANNIQLYERVGSVYTLIDSVVMATVSPGAAIASPKTDFGFSIDDPVELKAGVGLAVAMGQAVANGVVIRCQGGLY